MLLDPETFGWDLAILIMITASIAGCCGALWWYSKNKGRPLRRLIAATVAAFALLLAGLVVYGSFVEPRMLFTTTHTVSFPTKETLRIVVMSDFHVGPYKDADWVQRAVDQANAVLPDIVLLAGDFVLGDRSDTDALLPLSGLRPTIGTFAVLGNHDIGRIGWASDTPQIKRDRTADVETVLEHAGITVLRNENILVEWGDDQFAIAGNDDLWSDTFDLQAALQNIPKNTPVLLLSHNPSVIKDPAMSDQVRLVVSGHTHGGQLRLPGIGPITELPTVIDHRYDQGVFGAGENRSLFITRGIGESGPRARLFAPPEVALLLTK
jgi:hypothetical protein